MTAEIFIDPKTKKLRVVTDIFSLDDVMEIIKRER